MTPDLKKVFCVEDEMDIQTVARVALETVGNLTVEMCSSGSEALKVLPGYGPDIILLDVMMPEMDGPDTLAAIRQLPGFDQVPVIFMTAKVMDSDREHYRSLGAAGVIAKPFDPMKLADQVREIWAAHHEG
ncbi:MAG: response regulator [Rhodospirillales bacterium]|nr:response regulator [Rhodospirillales bacterium]